MIPPSVGILRQFALFLGLREEPVDGGRGYGEAAKVGVFTAPKKWARMGARQGISLIPAMH